MVALYSVAFGNFRFGRRVFLTLEYIQRTPQNAQGDLTLPFTLDSLLQRSALA